MQKTHQLENGLTIIVEEMPQFESVSYDLSVPGGIAYDDDTKIGASLILAELTTKGAGIYDAKQLSDAFDECGISHGEGCGMERYSYRGSLTLKHFNRALELVSLMISRPLLPQSEVESIRSLMLQEVRSLKDNPARLASQLMSAKYFPAPYSRPAIGTEEGLRAAEKSDLERLWSSYFKPRGSLLSIAGNVNFHEVILCVEKFFAAWQGQASAKPAYTKFPEPNVYHVPSDSAQLQIVLAYPSANFNDPEYYAAKVANQILSGGMFGRLFIEVREKRGLCYSVHSRHSANADYGLVQVYAGTTPERAHETLQVILMELSRLYRSVTEEELRRAKANLKSALVIGDESPGARATSNSSDWWISGRIRSLDEIIARIDAVSIANIDEYVSKYPPKQYTLLTLGSRDLSQYYSRST